MTQAKRLLVSVGEVDSELQGYNISLDGNTIFTSDYLQSPAAVTLSSAGEVTTGCFFDPGIEMVSQANNNSWSFTSLDPSTTNGGLQPVLSLGNSLTQCGISPLLNRALSGATANEDVQPYTSFVQSTIWSWAPGYPHNGNQQGDGNKLASNRCAALNAQTGFWQTEFCGASHFSACRAFGSPYNWSIARDNTAYEYSGRGCEAGSSFDVPRTALENRYLVHVWKEFVKTHDVGGDDLVWMDFNDLDVKGCWVIGQNQTCPYVKANDHERTVVVPTVAAVIVFVLAALTVFVKCAANRRRSKRRRRRGDDGWDYEGVPS